MDRDGDPGPDAEPIKPVSSLRAKFENLQSQKVPPPESDAPSSSSRPMQAGLKPIDPVKQPSFVRASLDLPRPASPWSAPQAEPQNAPRTPGPLAVPRGSDSPTKSGHKRPMSMLIQSSPQLTPSVQIDSPKSPPRGLFDRSQSRSPERIDTSAFAKVKDLVSQHSSRSSTRASTPGTELADMAPPVPVATRPRSKSPIPPPINRAEKPKIPTKPQNIIPTSDQGLSTRPLAFLNDQRASPFSTPPSSDEEQVPIETPRPRAQLQQPQPPPRRSLDLLNQNHESSQPVAVKQAMPPPSDPRLMGFSAVRGVPEQKDPRSLGFASAQPLSQADRGIKETPSSARILPPISAPVRDPRDLGFGASTPTSRRPSQQLPDHVSPPRHAPFVQSPHQQPPRDPRQFGFGSSTVPNTPVDASKPDLPQRSASKAAPPRPSEESKRPAYSPAISRNMPRIPAQPIADIRTSRSSDIPRHAIPAPIDSKFPPPPKRGTFNDADVLHHEHLEPPSTTLTRRKSFDVTIRDEDSDEYDELMPEPTTARHDYPDGSQANRRPPLTDAKNWQISAKADGKAFDICGHLLCTASYHTQVFDIITGEELLHISHGETVKTTTVVFKPGSDIRAEGKRIWVGNNLGDIQEIDIDTRVTIATSSAHNRTEIFRILRHHRDLWTLDEAGKLLIWQASEKAGGIPDLKAAPLTQKLLAKPNFAMVVQDTLWVSNGKETRVYRPGNDAAFNVRKGPLQLVQGAGDVTCGTYSENSGTVYLGHNDGKVSMYSLKDYSYTGHVKVSDYKINAMTIVGEKLWAVYKTGKAYVYNISTTPWKIEKDWKAHNGPATGILLDPSSVWLLGRLQVATVGHDQYVRLWDGLLEKDWIESTMHKRDAEYCTFRDVRAAVTTWNCGATIPALVKNNHFIADAIHAEESNPPEILVFGFQEVVDLEDRKVTAKSIFGFNKKKESASTDQQYQSKVYREWRDHLARLINKYLPQHSYSELHTSSLIGLLQCVFVRTNERRNIQNLSKQDVKCGMGGHYGNKGALVCRFTLDSSSICFVNCHLAAGQSQTMHRNNDIATILESEGLPHEENLDARSSLYVGGGDGRQILDHEICVLNGDLNYRIDTMPRNIIVRHIENGDLTKLVERDQLNVSRRRIAGFRLAPFFELPLTFAPTYKYDVGTDRYDSSEKKRSPAWCDRILYRSPGGRIKQTEYRRHEGVYESDHRPVSGVFSIRIKKVDEVKRKAVLESVDADFKKMRKAMLEEGCVRYLVGSFGLEREEARALIRRAK